MDISTTVNPVNNTFSYHLVQGRLASVEAMKTFDDGGTSLNFSIAYDYVYEVNGNTAFGSAFHKCVAFGAIAKALAVAPKGTIVAFEARQRTRKYQVNGENRYMTELIVIELLEVTTAQQAANQ